MRWVLYKSTRVAEVIEFYQIYYNDYQKSSLFPFAIPYFNEGLTVFFENAIIKDIVPSSNADRIAVCSWKLKNKMRWRVKSRQELTLSRLYSDYEVASFTSNTNHHKMLAFADIHHPGFYDTLKMIADQVGFPMPYEVKDPIYQNSFCARTDIYKDYVKNYLSPAMWVMENVKPIHDRCMKDANYQGLTSDALSPTMMKLKTGIGYYTMHTFLLERLFSIYCHNHKIKVTYL